MPATWLILAVVSAAISRGGSVEVPVDVGVGPAAFLFFGPVFEDQPIHAGIKIDVEAVIDQALLRKNERRIPGKYKSLARKIEEVRIRPSPFIPDSLIISPKINQTGMFGISWRPLSFGLSSGAGAARLSLSAGLMLTYAYLYSDTLPTTHFARPGADVRASVELAATKSFLLGIGWSSAFYIPQELGGFGLAPLDQAIFHVGQAFLQLHFRFPYRTNL